MNLEHFEGFKKVTATSENHSDLTHTIDFEAEVFIFYPFREITANVLH